MGLDHILILVGLVADIVGASFLAWPLWTTFEQAAIESVTRLSNVARIQRRLRDRSYMRIGLFLLIFGFTLQIAGNLIQAYY